MARKGKNKKRKLKDAVERPIRFRNYQQFFLIVCEDENTEPYYFDEFKALFPKNTLFLETVGTGRDPLGVVQQAIIERDKLAELSNKEIDFVWTVFDKDDADENDAKIRRFEQAFELAEEETIHIAYSNEVFELWLLLHISEVEAGKSIPRKIIYEQLGILIRKNDKYKEFVYEHGNEDIIEVIKNIGNEEIATERAKSLLDFYKDILPIKANPSTKVHILVKELRDWIAYYNWKPES